MNGNIFFELFLRDLDAKITSAGSLGPARIENKTKNRTEGITNRIQIYRFPGYEAGDDGKET